MNDHHLILGQLADIVTGRIIDDTHDERYRQRIARLLLESKGYDRSELRSQQAIQINVGPKAARVPVTFLVELAGHIAMLLQYGPGSLVTRHRPALAMAKLVAPYQVPVVVVTNGEQADILEATSGRLTATGLDRIPAREELVRRLTDHAWSPVPERHVQMAARIVMAFEVDDRCPCDDTVCRLDDGHENGSGLLGKTLD